MQNDIKPTKNHPIYKLINTLGRDFCYDLLVKFRRGRMYSNSIDVIKTTVETVMMTDVVYVYHKKHLNSMNAYIYFLHKYMDMNCSVIKDIVKTTESVVRDRIAIVDRLLTMTVTNEKSLVEKLKNIDMILSLHFNKFNN